MFGEAISWYMTSMAEFWGSAFRIGLPQILLIVLVICWLRRKGSGKECSWLWSCKWCGEEEEDADGWAADCGCTCGHCCCRQGGDTDAGDEDHDDE